MSSLVGGTGYTGIQSPSGRTGNKIPKGYSSGQIKQYTPEQEQLFQQGIGNVGPDSYLSKLAGGDEDLFNQIESPALQQFSELQGGLASRFSGMGGLGARKSSGFQNTQNQAASSFAQQLQANRQNLRQQAIQDLHGMSQDLLGNRPYEQFLTEKAKPWWQEAATGFASGLGSGIGL